MRPSWLAHKLKILSCARQQVLICVEWDLWYMQAFKMTNWILNFHLIHLTSALQCRGPPYACMKSAGKSGNWLYVYIMSNARQVTLSWCKLLWEYTLVFARFLVTKLSHSSVAAIIVLGVRGLLVAVLKTVLVWAQLLLSWYGCSCIENLRAIWMDIPAMLLKFTTLVGFSLLRCCRLCVFLCSCVSLVGFLIDKETKFATFPRRYFKALGFLWKKTGDGEIYKFVFSFLVSWAYFDC